MDELPAADGGEGTAAALLAALGGRWIEAPASDASGRPVAARFALLADGTAALDAAEAIGLGRLEPEELDPLTATSRGAGELIAAALATAPAVVVGAGGTATVDGGAGALAALTGVAAGRVRVACDVRTCWEAAPRLFGPQKGADAAGVEELEERLDRLARSLPRDPRGVPATGCGGGLSGGLWAGLGAELVPGAELVLDAIRFADASRGADLVVTGEGRLDDQTAAGKLVAEVATRARLAGVACAAVVGCDALAPGRARELGLETVLEAGDPGALEEAGRRLGASFGRPG